MLQKLNENLHPTSNKKKAEKIKSLLIKKSVSCKFGSVSSECATKKHPTPIILEPSTVRFMKNYAISNTTGSAAVTRVPDIKSAAEEEEERAVVERYSSTNAKKKENFL